MPEKTGCAFCDRIAAREWLAFADSPEVVWFPPLNPVTPGHTLFVPVTHAQDALADPKLTGGVMSVAARYARESSGVPAWNIITSAGALATQTIWHLHIHLIPRRKGDGLHLPWHHGSA